MEKEIILKNHDFLNFLRCLSAVKDLFNDADIRGGVLRQKSNDKANIVEMDLTSLISDSDLPLSDLKSKLPLLKGLSRHDVQLTIADEEVYFSGKRSSLRFKNPIRDFMGNKFLSEEEFSKLFTLREEDLLFEHVVKKDISDFMKVIAGQLSVTSFQILFHGNVVSITASTLKKDGYSEIESGIPTQKSLKCFSNVVNTPFLLDHDRNMLFKMYNVQETVCVSKFTSSIRNVVMDVYGRSQLINEDEGEECFNPSKEAIDQDVTEKE